MVNIVELKRKSILDVGETLGLHFKRVSGVIYEHPEHDSFRVFLDTNTFKWFSKDIGGDVIDFVRVVAQADFKQAISFLERGDFKEHKIQERKQIPFDYYLQHHEKNHFLDARHYLTSVRGLSDETINFFGRQGVLSQALLKERNDSTEPVVVFKYLDHRGKIAGASLQGIIENKECHERGRLKKLMKHSNGYIGLSVDIGKPKRLLSAESAINLMSYYQCHKEELKDVRLVAMDNLKKGVISYHLL